MSLNCKICPNNDINEFACETCMFEELINVLRNNN